VAASLVDQLQEQTLDSSVSISDLLRRVKVVASELGIPDLAAWADRELNGYADDDEFPKYRLIQAELKGWNPVSRQWLPISWNTEKETNAFGRPRPVNSPISEIEQLIKKAPNTLAIQLRPAQKAELMRVIGAEVEALTSSTSIHAVVDAVRNIVVDWTIRLKKSGIVGAGMSFSDAEKRRAQTGDLHISINNSGAMSVGALGPVFDQAVATSNQTLSSGLDVRGIRELVAAIAVASHQGRFGLPAEQQQALDAEILELEKETQKPNPKASLVTRALKSVQKILKAAATDATTQLVVQGAILGIEKLLGS